MFLRSGAPDIERYQGVFISEKDIEIIVNEVKGQGFRLEQVDL